MGSTCARELSEEEIRSKKRSKQLGKICDDGNKKYEAEIKLLLLGAGDSGKSTFTRQISVLHGAGLDEEREKFQAVLRDNCLESMRAVLLMMNEVEGEDFLGPKMAKHVEEVLACEDYEMLEPVHGKAINTLGKTKAVLQFYQDYENALQIPSGTTYFWSNAKRISEKNYMPTNEDIIRCKLRTTGIQEIKFLHNGFNFTLVDVGGQRSERRKWLPSFQGVKAIIFLTAIDEYDGKVLAEDSNTDRLVESLNLFEKLTESEWLNQTTFILFLNKIDLFQMKLARKPLSEMTTRYPDYAEFLEENKKNFKGLSDYDIGLQYFTEMFQSRYSGENDRVFTHCTCAIDTEQAKNLFTSIYEQAVISNLNSIGI